MIIRSIKQSEYLKSQELIKKVFSTTEHSDHEDILVQNLRKESEYIPELDIVAIIEDEIVGHVMLTKIKIGNYDKGLCLAPLAVKPEMHNKGIGSKLINYAEEKSQELGFESIHILGYPEYYSKFGYKPASNYNIQASFSVDDKNYMIKELKSNALKNISGIIEYQKSFGI